MKFSIIVVTCSFLFSCSDNEDVLAQFETSADTSPRLLANEVRTYDELEAYLRQEYGDVQSLPSVWQSAGNGDSGSGPFWFRLPDGSEISVDGIYSRATGQIVDPAFDLRTLPEIGTN